ncbi:MAG: HAD-IA family hydrolase, partial [Prochlorococcaceae cyanobacterium]
DDPELESGKPAPDPFLLAARRLGVEPRCCWAFEDSLAGAAAAAAAGCQVVVLLCAGDDGARFPEGSRCLHSLRDVELS